MRYIFIHLLILVCSISIMHSVSAQTDNYWSWSFNTPSTLLAGSVTGGGAGPSAVYYNPALIDQENIPNFSLSANLISLQFFKATNIAGEGNDAKQFVFKIQPRFISYTLDNKNEKIGIEVAILTPISEEIRYSGQYLDTLDVINRMLGDEVYSGYLNYSRRYDDLWFGGGLSYRFSDQFFIGMSGFASVKTLKYQYIEEAKAYPKGDSVVINGNYEPSYIATVGFQEEFKYWFVSLIYKLGIQYRTANNRLSVGLNLTLPDIPVIGRGDVRKEISRSNIFNDDEGEFVSNENVIGTEEDIKVRVKNPFSAALGLQFISANMNSTISFNMEYFNKIDPYAIVNSTNQVSWLQNTPSTELPLNDFLSYTFEARSVTNAAVGFKQVISSSFYVLAGFRTDFTAISAENEDINSKITSVDQIQINKYHITFGPVWKFKRYKIITGLQYTLGRNNDTFQRVNYSNPIEYNPSTDQSLVGIGRTSAEAALNEIALFFGFSIDLNHE